VAVETDEIHLLKYALMAAKAGKHIHMEKPGSQSLRDFERLVETVRRTGKVLHLGYMYRYNPVIADAIRRVKAGEFGTVYSVEAHMSRLDVKATREWFGSFRGGMMFYLGCHLVDLVLQIQGVPEQVIPLNTATGLDGVDTEDIGFAVLRYPNGISVVRASGTEVDGFNRRQLVICGSKRTAEIRPLEANVNNTDRPYMIYTEKVETYIDDDGLDVRKSSRSEVFQRYENMLLAFGQMVRGEKENPYTTEYELMLFRVLMQCCGIEQDEC
jgi:predicted dehydrogenase